ncbi:lanthionine synthetase C family protein [Sphaerisporangium fuscum]|uniref:lanthionine synthetase C family protein n=1 Tax=Sphaerisporangium fuscum TaxID=2835868 RepID=UPI001BDDBA98|nr:lanthionine synthetase C family protein [Sphaerisporangium fuscum]
MSRQDQRERAREVVDRLLERLADPDATAAATGFAAEVSDDGRAQSLWEDLSLADGYPGVSLAFSGTTHRDKRQVVAAHRYLARATAAGEGAAGTVSIYGGVGALAFATLVAHRRTGGYVAALGRLDDYARRLTRAALPSVTGAPVASNGEFEVVRGMSGLGRYLLARAETCGAELEMVLTYLVSMSRGDVAHRGLRVPHWWSMAPPRAGMEDRLPDGHLNLGLSHGVSGPLALLSLAWRDGHVVEGQREAIESIVGLLRRWAVEDEHGPHWPSHVSIEEWAAGRASPRTRQRPSWCYGSPGVSRAVQLAALALGRDDWHELAHASVLAVLATPWEEWSVPDAGLCHGWSGLLHLVGLLNGHLGDERLDRARDELAATVITRFREDLPFGYRFAQGADMSGFLEGAAGVALALDAYACDGPTVGWDAALLVS